MIARIIVINLFNLMAGDSHFGEFVRKKAGQN